jgi:hypothetical protein
VPLVPSLAYAKYTFDPSHSGADHVGIVKGYYGDATCSVGSGTLSVLNGTCPVYPDWVSAAAGYPTSEAANVTASLPVRHPRVF